MQLCGKPDCQSCNLKERKGLNEVKGEKAKVRVALKCLEDLLFGKNKRFMLGILLRFLKRDFLGFGEGEANLIL